ncbi:MAG: universal stress protein [Candidatus Tectimicrobiota bacterium]|nr:MAG: universal stress protein [Candidatus Tectomicrobia bacterium]
MIPQHFLVPLDFSAYSDRALDYAVELARKLGARLTLLHVIHAMPLGVPEAGVALPVSYWQQLEAEVGQIMNQYLSKVGQGGIRGEVVIAHGVPFQEIVEAAKARQADLIVMGTHGRTGLQHVLLGSVTEKVIRLAPCPVLVVRGAGTAAKATS